MVASHQWIIELADEQATQDFAEDLAHNIKANDVITLSGDLGVGKTTLARSLIRALCQDPQMDVPSPTFTLMQIYDDPASPSPCPIVHADLYRITHADELLQLGWDDACDGSAVLVEWAERGGSYIPDDRLDLALHLNLAQSDTSRRLVMTAYGSWVERMKQARLVTDFLIAAQWQDASRHFMLGDASTRAYERLVKPDGQQAILMISPKRPDGPPLRQGKSYSVLAHLAEDISAFIAIDKGLNAVGVNVPHLYYYDIEKGLALIEDLGAGLCVDDHGPIAERYQEAVELLAYLHRQDMPAQIDVDGTSYHLPAYDMDALLIEVELFLEWYVPHIAQIELSSAAQATFINIWRQLLTPFANAHQNWVLRDYHSPNLIWCPTREGRDRIGVIDFQDCVRGHGAYDVVSLLQDARVTVSDEMELNMLAHYVRQYRGIADFKLAYFMCAYAVFGAQRATKILGIFARLDRRDHKPHYLKHIPRVHVYLCKNIAHISLKPLRQWFETYMPDMLHGKAAPSDEPV